ncbi:tetratricopeptide repeat protein [Streptomyces blastmyceticus]|uniref:Tetratricopeptide repeat protein n=1 Tax=Streptomyces blastmyceticus TaxID=68180 RepID=A0ABN0W7X0_9ACTN
MSTTTPGAVARAMALIEIERYEQAEKILRDHLALEPDDSRAWERLSVCRFEARDYVGARRAAEESLRVNPDEADAHLRRSEAFRANTMWYDAVDAAREGVRLLPQEPIPRVVLAKALRLLPGGEGLGEAYATALEAIRLSPELASAHFALYIVAYDMGRKDICEQAMRHVLTFDPGNGSARNNLAALAAERPHADLYDALGDVSAALAADPNSPHAHHNLRFITGKLMRRACWPALACFAVAIFTMVVSDTSEPGRDLPPSIPLVARLAGIAAMAALWTGCLLWARHRIPAPLRGFVTQLPRRSVPVRAIAVGAAWCTLFSVLLLTVRLDPQWLLGAFNISALGGLGACMAFATRTKGGKARR